MIGSIAWLAAAASLAPPAALAQSATAPAEPPAAAEAFALGQIIVTAPRSEQVAVTGSTLSRETIHTFNRNTLDDAVNLIPGVNASTTGGARNERLIYVRGFDRFQTPLAVDGIRVYLPADNRLDFGRFLTPDISEIQVAKGYASVLDGPGAMGGLINLVTRKPTEPFEAEGRATLGGDSDGDYAGYNLFLLAGARRDRWYAQASYTRNEVDHWDLPGDFRPTATEDGGARDLSATQDWRLNVKVGVTPNATDEYVVSFTRQEGAKNAPLHVSDPLAIQRFWSWPFWNIDSLYFLSTTALGDRLTLKTRAYRNTFYNLLRSFDDRAQTTQTLPRAFNSFYEDEAYGGSAQLDVRVTGADTLRFAAHYRRDRHVEHQQVFPSSFTEPPQVNEEDTFSLSAENALQLSPDLTWTLGVSYDWRDLHRAEEYGTPPSGGAATIFSYPIRNADAWNAQSRLDWRLENGSSAYALVSSRARFPTIFDRFSSRLGGQVSNPDLAAERATTFELGGARRFGGVRVEGAVFYSHLDDVITAFPFLFQNQAVSQSRNLGSGDYHGLELAFAARVSSTLSAGGNYTWIERSIDDPSNAAFRPTGVPTHKAFLYVQWTPARGLRITPNLEGASDRWTVNTAGTRYYRTGSYLEAGLRADYALTERVELGISGRNLFDDHHQFVDGFPEPGRSVFASVRARY